MIKKMSTKYERVDTIDFIIDDDKEMKWISNFDSSKFERFFVVIDRNVNQIWGNIINKRLKAHNKEVFTFEIDAVEESKSLSFYPKLVSFFEQHKCNLSDLVLAIGGGVIIDLVSFTCSTYMRGLSFIAVPTTLVGQVDASTAGKTCLNTDNSKNILGTFYYPLQVYNNIHFLKTNSEYYLRQGYSEIFKYGLLCSPKLINLLLEYHNNPTDKLLIEIINLAINARVKIRKINPLASNLGHTFGHAIENLSKFKVLHGDAISAGIIISLFFSKKMGLTDSKIIAQITRKMKELGLNIYIEKNLDAEKMLDVMMRDKKSSSKYINLVLIKGIAQPYVKESVPFYRTTPDVLKGFLVEFLNEYAYKTDAKKIQNNNLRYEE